MALHLQGQGMMLQAMAWLGASMVLVTSLRYMLFAPSSGAYTELFAVSAEAPPPTMVLAIPAANAALLLMVLSLYPFLHHVSLSSHVASRWLFCILLLLTPCITISVQQERAGGQCGVGQYHSSGGKLTGVPRPVTILLGTPCWHQGNIPAE